MFAKLFVLTALLVGVNSRYVLMEVPSYYIHDGDHIVEPHVPQHLRARVRRQAQGSVTVNSDGTSGAAVKIPIVGNDRNILSAIGSADLNKNFKLSETSAGLALDNVNGHGLSLTKSHIPGFGDRITAAGTVNLLHTDNHDLNANAFGIKQMPNIPHVPNFNTVGGGLDYMFKEKVGASVSAAHSDFINRNDYSAGAKLNVFRSPSTSLDFNAGWKKFDTPFMKSNWEPNYGFSFSKYF